MTRDEVKAIIERFLAEFSTGRWDDPDYLLQSLADDLEWWVPGSPLVAGCYTKEQYKEWCKMSAALGAAPDVVTPVSWVIEGDTAAVETEGEMLLPDGSVYRNRHHMRFRVKDGKICLIKEYCDTIAMKNATEIILAHNPGFTVDRQAI